MPADPLRDTFSGGKVRLRSMDSACGKAICTQDGLNGKRRNAALSELPGYQGKPEEILRKSGVRVFDEIEIATEKHMLRGVLMPRYELADNRHVVIKLHTGYNIGLRVDAIKSIVRVAGASPAVRRSPPPERERKDLPSVSVVSTGGTIASRVDYRTGAVTPALTAEDLYLLVPELANIANISAHTMYSVMSENITPRHWSEIAVAVDQMIRSGVDGVVIAHGTDTLAMTSAALSFALRNPPIPIALVGAQRSSDRPSSDAVTNLLAAVTVAAGAPFGEVVLVMHEGYSDDSIAIHRGTKARKMHTSSRSAFQSVNSKPIARYVEGVIKLGDEQLHRRGDSDSYTVEPGFDDRAALVKFYPGLDPEIMRWLVQRGMRGIVLEGTGLGHVSNRMVEAASGLVRDGVFVGMTSQCLFGQVNLNVYETGRDLLEAGVTPLGDMLPETSLIKLMWCLARANEPDEIRRLMLSNLAGELSPRCLPALETKPK